MRLTAFLLLSTVCSATLARDTAHRTLSFEDRVRAQTAIERVYYAHQLGATRSFDDAMPEGALERKVRQYLEQTAALDLYWKTAVTDETLERELLRMAHGTRMPERLRELYAALGNDSFLIKECLARATLVDRLTRNFYAFDPTLHVRSRAQAELLRRLLLAGRLRPSTEHPNRTVSGRPTPALRAGQVSEVRESRDAFTFEVVLSATASEARVASYVIPKTAWDVWWETAHRALRDRPVAAVAGEGAPAVLDTLPCAADDTWDSGSLGDLPEARTDHTAVWTGSVMVVWGGSGAAGVLDTGGRYDPATDSWAATSTTGAPSARSAHTAVWTAGSMVVWGGHDASDSVLDTGGRYDPATDSWLPTSMKDAPEARDGHTAVGTGTLMLVWGGQGAGGGFGSGGRYDPVTDTWSPISTIDAPAARRAHVAVWTGDELVVWGGRQIGGGLLISGGRYDPVMDEWKPISPIGFPTQLHGGFTAVWTGREMLIWGDVDRSIGTRYDPVADTWTPMSTIGAPSPRTRHTALWTGTRMLVWAGQGSRGRGVGTGGIYDPARDEWTATSNVAPPSARFGHAAIWTGELMLVWGGFGVYDTSGGPGIHFNTGGRYDPVTDSWTPTSTLGAHAAQLGHSAIWTGNLMVVWGGGLPDGSLHDLNTGARYDPATDNWSPTSTTNAPSAREHHTAVWTGDAMIVWGGDADGFIGNLDTGGRYDPTTDLWLPTSTTNAPSARSGHTAVWTGNRMVVWGGFAFPKDLDSGGRYDPASDSWTPTSTTAAPPARRNHTAVWTGSLMVVWGGDSENGGLSSGGRYHPATDSWTPTSITDAPFSHGDHTSVWTGTLMLVWGGFPNAAGRYDPVADSWTTISTTDAPSDRSGHTAVWTGRDMVVWGGRAFDRLDTGGRYDPATDIWKPTSTMQAPSARSGHTAVWTGSHMLIWGGDSLINVERIGRYALGSSSDDDGDGYNECEGDCNDANPAVHPGAAESCNGVDDDCDGTIDNGAAEQCDDGNACTAGDACSGGMCVGGAPRVCTALDACHAAGVCDQATGACSNPIVPDGTACDDANLCTAGDTCRSGTCTPTFNGLNHPNPRSSGYYKQLCERAERGQCPYHGDRIEDADAQCVAGLASTFDDLETARDLCDVLEHDSERRHRRHHGRGHGHGHDSSTNECDKAESELIATALNICRARVCEEQSLDSRCRGNSHSTVSQSFADADAILDNAARGRQACKLASCELREINNGHALEMNSLWLSREGNAVRLSWLPPVLDDGSGGPNTYELWRRPLGSSGAYVKIGTTTRLTFLDTTAGASAWEYEITTVAASLLILE